jgi:hypothetical protein
MTSHMDDLHTNEPALRDIPLTWGNLARLPLLRFQPTCSHYGYQAIAKYGLFKGGWMAIRRVFRCHPLNPGGYDPVP